MNNTNNHNTMSGQHSGKQRRPTSKHRPASYSTHQTGTLPSTSAIDAVTSQLGITTIPILLFISCIASLHFGYFAFHPRPVSSLHSRWIEPETPISHPSIDQTSSLRNPYETSAYSHSISRITLDPARTSIRNFYPLCNVHLQPRLTNQPGHTRIIRNPAPNPPPPEELS
ncbi:hypothetical protein P691DRAFT_426530 [Macrolepiota fuliginosa MF-IS2]|uniref:Uncharacterized protein n=1 Tax=Macrolepiota fuliginosa MF-IS2 TaxID=1400762 RepID=A0A9P5X2D2_9AGAR|nr:hypothetical protein P691DRAFT_426530 [Macrolepiota fuliginosa MF-IS2]